MKKALLGLVFLALLLPSCATCHAVKWAYNAPSCHGEVDEGASVLRPAIGVPFILLSAAWDFLTWPEQLIFGVWPMWGENSKHMKP
jgi:hypothetical protein